MADDRDLASILPDAPPPRPAARTAAIDAALRRFDGEAVEQPRPASAPAPRPGWRWWQPVGALASVALVAALSFPLWRSEQSKLVPPSLDLPAAPEASPSGAARVEPVTADRAPALDAPTPERPAADSVQQAKSAGIAQSPRIAPVEASSGQASAPEVEELPPPPPPPPAAAPPPAPVAAAAPARAAEEAADVADGNIVVTGTRVQQRQVSPIPLAPLAVVQTSARGDWNACTIDDPARALAQCRQAIAGAPASFADGLSAAWRGDLDGALAAFDAAVRRARGFAPAYLNRGLVHARKGDLARAIADLDRAIRIDPNAARFYYHRSRLHAESGEAQKAQGDARRALRLDPAYRAVLR